MAKKRQKFFWHVAPGSWFEGVSVALGGNANVSADIVVPLVDAETAIAARPEVDNFVVERIIGQYQVTFDESTPLSKYAHSCVYVADADLASISLRGLNLQDDAETSLLWHQVDPLPGANDGSIWGNWVSHGGTTNPNATAWQGRYGHVDIRVGRRLEGGQSLIWHTEFTPPPVGDATHFLKLWLRMLVREG